MKRVPQYEIEPLFPERWSPRAMNGEAMETELLHRLFEAARWAPSSGNSQPWRFVYAQAKTPSFDRLFNLLAGGNQPWCKHAGALVVVAARTTNDKGDKLPTALFDTGSAWMSLALQASRMGLVAHGMAGFDYARAKSELGFPDEYAVCCMIALGHPGSRDDLPEPYRGREEPSDRKPQETFVFEGAFKPAT